MLCIQAETPGLALQISTSPWLFPLHDPLVSHLQLSSIEGEKKQKHKLPSTTNQLQATQYNQQALIQAHHALHQTHAH